MRRAVALVAGVALVLPGPAAAHVHSSRSAVDFRASAAPLRAPLAGAVGVRIYRSDLALGLTLLGHHRVVVLGYLGEPFLRLGPAGVYVNDASPTAAGTKLAPPAHRRGIDWRLRSRRPQVIWHDARLRGLTRGVHHGKWSVPLVVDGRRASLEGTIERVDPPSGRGWLAIGLAFAALTGVLLALRSQRALRTACTALGALAGAATLLTAAGFSAGATASEAIWVESANEAAFILVGGVILARGSRDARALAGGFIGFVALVTGLTRLPVLSHGIVLSALPGQLARLAVVLSISSGAAAAILGAVVFVDVMRHYEDPELKRVARS